MTTTQVTVELKTQAGIPYANAIITSILTKVDVDTDDTYIIPEEKTWRTDETGVAVLDLWPNTLGTKQSRYRITGSTTDGQIVLDVYAVVPNSGTANLADIAEDITCFEGCGSVNNASSDEDIAQAIAQHEAKLNPHPQYATQAQLASAISAHEAKPNPHSQYVLNSDLGVSVAQLEDGKVPEEQLPDALIGAMNYKGNWNADTNTPTLASSEGEKGDFYVVSVSGVTELDSVSTWVKGDFLIFTTVWVRIPVSGYVDSVNGKTGTVTINADDVADTASKKIMTSAERDKLAAIAAQATKNQTDNYLLNRANHTDTQSADSIVDGTTNKVFTAAEKTKLSTIEENATANSSDADLLNRANHTGTQGIETIDGLQAALDDKGNFSSDVGADFVADDVPIVTFFDGQKTLLKESGVKVNNKKQLYGNNRKVIVFTGTTLMLNETHASCIILCTNNSADITIFLPDLVSAPLDDGFTADIVQFSDKKVSVQPIGSATMKSPIIPAKTKTKNEVIGVMKTSGNEWLVMPNQSTQSASPNNIVIVNFPVTISTTGAYLLDYTAGVFDVTLDTAISAGTILDFYVIGGDVEAAATKPNILNNANLINGLDENIEVDVNFSHFKLVMSNDATQGFTLSA